MRNLFLAGVQDSKPCCGWCKHHWGWPVPANRVAFLMTSFRVPMFLFLIGHPHPSHMAYLVMLHVSLLDENWFPSTCWIDYGCKWCWLCPIIGSSSCHQLPNANNVIGVEAIVIEPVVNTQNWFLLLSLGFELCSNYFYALNFLLLSFFVTVWLLSAGSQLWRFLRRRCRIFGAQEKGWVLSHWAGEPANSFSIDEFSFPKNVVSCSSSFSLPPTHVGG